MSKWLNKLSTCPPWNATRGQKEQTVIYTRIWTALQGSIQNEKQPISKGYILLEVCRPQKVTDSVIWHSWNHKIIDMENRLVNGRVEGGRGGECLAIKGWLHEGSLRWWNCPGDHTNLQVTKLYQTKYTRTYVHQWVHVQLVRPADAHGLCPGECPDVVMCYSFTRRYHWGKPGERYIGPLCIIFHKCRSAVILREF